MKERPILFSGAMVRAILDGRKTQTRRVLKLPHQNPLGAWEPTTIGGPHGGRTASGETIPLQGGIWHTRTGGCLMHPKGQPGDRLYVRESLAPTRNEAGTVIDWHYAADGAKVSRMPGLKSEFGDAMAFAHLARMSVPSIHMPRWASRILLEIVSVRVERLNDCSVRDAIAEGLWRDDEVPFNGPWFASTDSHRGFADPREAYESLWDSINGAGAWAANPWVWVVEFRRI